MNSKPAAINGEADYQMLPDICKEKKITFIMGAGSSIPFIRNDGRCLSTDYLTDQITNRERWTDIYNEFKESIPQSRFPQENFNISLEDILSIIEKIKSINELQVDATTREKSGGLLPHKIDDIYGIGKINFEYILYLLDKVSNYLYDRKNGVDNILFDIWGEHAKEKESLRWLKKGWNYVPFLCREVLVKTILDLWQSCPKKEAAIQDNKKFFTSILEKFLAVSIYSINYDPLLYEAVKQIRVAGLGDREYEHEKLFETGFSDANNFNPKVFYHSHNIIAFLHGHVGFVPEGGMRFDQDYVKAQERRIIGVACGEVSYYRRGVKGIHYNVSLVGGLEKFEGFYENPYACYIQRFAEDLMESDYIVLTGVGLGDYHINLFLSNTWLVANGLADDPRNPLAIRKYVEGKKVIIVTRDDELREKWIYYFFETRWGNEFIGLLKEEGISGHNSDSVSTSLRDKGYAWVNPNLFFYRLGAERFFAEINEIPDLFRPQ